MSSNFHEDTDFRLSSRNSKGWATLGSDSHIPLWWDKQGPGLPQPSPGLSPSLILLAWPLQAFAFVLVLSKDNYGGKAFGPPGSTSSRAESNTQASLRCLLQFEFIPETPFLLDTPTSENLPPAPQPGIHLPRLRASPPQNRHLNLLDWLSATRIFKRQNTFLFKKQDYKRLNLTFIVSRPACLLPSASNSTPVSLGGESVLPHSWSMWFGWGWVHFHFQGQACDLVRSIQSWPQWLGEKYSLSSGTKTKDDGSLGISLWIWPV